MLEWWLMNKVIIRSIKDQGKLLDITETKKAKLGHFVFKPGGGFPAHVAEDREEVILVLRGVASIKAGGEDYQVKARQFMYIPCGIRHEVKNRGKEDLEYVYFVAMLK